MSIYSVYLISYDENNSGNFIKVRQAVLKLAYKARYHLKMNLISMLYINLNNVQLSQLTLANNCESNSFLDRMLLYIIYFFANDHQNKLLQFSFTVCKIIILIPSQVNNSYDSIEWIYISCHNYNFPFFHTTSRA